MALSWFRMQQQVWQMRWQRSLPCPRHQQHQQRWQRPTRRQLRQCHPRRQRPPRNAMPRCPLREARQQQQQQCSPPCAMPCRLPAVQHQQVLQLAAPPHLASAPCATLCPQPALQQPLELQLAVPPHLALGAQQPAASFTPNPPRRTPQCWQCCAARWPQHSTATSSHWAARAASSPCRLAASTAGADWQ